MRIEAAEMEIVKMHLTVQALYNGLILNQRQVHVVGPIPVTDSQHITFEHDWRLFSSELNEALFFSLS